MNIAKFNTTGLETIASGWTPLNFERLTLVNDNRGLCSSKGNAIRGCQRATHNVQVALRQTPFHRKPGGTQRI